MPSVVSIVVDALVPSVVSIVVDALVPGGSSGPCFKDPSLDDPTPDIPTLYRTSNPDNIP